MSAGHQAPQTVSLDDIQPRLSANSTTQELTDEILRLGGLLAYAEHQYGVLAAQEASLKDRYDLRMTLATAALDKKLTETAKRSTILSTEPEVENMKIVHIQAETELLRWKGVRDGLRASYDAVSRVVTVRQMELELAKGGG